jgi:hypothetical protein
LLLTYSHVWQGERLSGKCIFFVRVNPKGVNEKTLESDVAVGEIQGSALDTFRALLADLFLPVLQEQSSWGKMPPQHTKDFLTGASSAQQTRSLCKLTRLLLHSLARLPTCSPHQSRKAAGQHGVGHHTMLRLLLLLSVCRCQAHCSRAG